MLTIDNVKGTRVKLSELGIASKMKIAPIGAKGTVTSRYIYDECVTVRWDRRKATTRVHIDFLTEASE